MLLLAIIQVAIPLAAVLWLGIGRPSTRSALLARLAGSWLALLGIAVAGVWLSLPLMTVGVLAALMLASSIVAVRTFSTRPTSQPKHNGWPSRIFAIALASFGLWAVVPTFVGWKSPPDAVDLDFPFREGRYLVANGGMSERINGHFLTLDPSFRRWRGESYGVDLIRIDDAGFRTKARRPFHAPPDPAAYLTFGTPVLSPCTGRVEAAENRRPDMQVPTRDRQNLAGNFVRLKCGNHIVLLAHFRRGGVYVQSGQRVRAGGLLGEVGNSGNTDEPHLHVHVQMPGSDDEPLSGDPVPLTFEGRFPVRNMVLGGA